MNIALVGYGKMGKAIEKVALEHGHTITTIVNSDNPIEHANFEHVDIAIEFSTPQLVVKHINFFLNNSIPCVIGTTGWNDELKNITRLALEKNSSFLHASNFSIGVNLFFKLNEQLAQLMSNHPSYRADMVEIHHTEKLDSPSGTAITLANGIIENNANYEKWFCPQGESNNTDNQGISIEAIREPEVSGTHTVNYSSTIDTLSITHEAHNRTGFATGAVIAAEWLIHKKGIFTMRDVLNIK